MRIYVPILCSDMAVSEISARIVHCVNDEARCAFPSDDEESLEMLATLYAADGAVLLMREQKNEEGEEHNSEGGIGGEAVCLRRIIAVGEVPDAWVKPLSATAGNGIFPDEKCDSNNENTGNKDAGNKDSGEISEAISDAPTAARLICALPWEKIESIHVDEPGNEQLVQRAIEGDERAFETSGDIELLWYDVTERDHLLAELLC